MKFCISNNHSLDTLNQADEIMYQGSIKKINKTLVKHNKILIIELNTTNYNELNLIKSIITEEKVNIAVKISNEAYISKLNDMQIKWIYGVPISNYADLNLMCGKGASALYLGQPLCFDLDRVKEVLNLYPQNIQIRAIPNNPYFTSLASHGDPTFYSHRGFWIRPEDIPLYESYIDVLDLICIPANREKELFSIYKSQSYKGLLSFLIPSIGTGIINELVPKKLIKKRLNCNQKCFALKANCDDCSIFLNSTKINNILSELKRGKDQ